MGERRRGSASAPAGEQRRERRSQDVFRARTPETGEEPAEDPGQRLDLQIRFLRPTREQVERRRIGLVAEVDQDDVVDPGARDPLQQCVHEVALGLEQRKTEPSSDPLEGEVEKQRRFAASSRAEHVRVLQKRVRCDA